MYAVAHVADGAPGCMCVWRGSEGGGVFSHAYMFFGRLERDVPSACLHPQAAHQLVTGCRGCCNFQGKCRYLRGTNLLTFITFDFEKEISALGLFVFCFSKSFLRVNPGMMLIPLNRFHDCLEPTPIEDNCKTSDPFVHSFEYMPGKMVKK